MKNLLSKKIKFNNQVFTNQLLKRAIAVIIFLLIVLYIIQAQIHSNQSKTYKIKTIVIDPGHGGRDPGALGKKSKEKDITLGISLKLGSYIEKNFPDVNILYTRTSDEFIELHKRAELANQNSADLFISIHVNAIRDSRITGTSTYVMGLNKTEENIEVAKLENSVILKEDNYVSKYEGFDPNSPESHIIFSLVQNTFLEQSMNFAAKIQEQFSKKAGRTDRGVRQAGLVVLWNSTMPAVLVETGFITNRTEEKYLASKYGQEIIASAVFRAFREYKYLIENKINYYPSKNPEKIEKYEKLEIKNNLNHLRVGYSDNASDYSKNQNIIFKIQIVSSPKKIPFTSDLFRGLEGVKEFQQNGIYKYTYGEKSELEDIIKIQNGLRKNFPNAFVIAFKEGKRIPFTEAVKVSGN